MFTDADAEACGFSVAARSYHRSTGNWLPTAAPGIWRLADWPVDGADAARAWSLWMLPRFQATSWTALELLGQVPVEPGRPVHVVPSVTGDAVLRTRSRRRQRDAARRSGALVLHRAQNRWDQCSTVDGLNVRPAPEALCLAIAYGAATAPLPVAPCRAAEELLDDLLGRGVVQLSELIQTASTLGAPWVLDLLWERSTGS